jgi:hypothetical protein
MKTRSCSAIVALLLAFSAFAFAALVVVPSSCTAPGAGQLPSRAFVDASRAIHGAIGARFQAYVRADLSLDPTTRETLVRTVDDWEFMVRQAEAALEPALPAPAPPAPAPTGGVHQ